MPKKERIEKKEQSNQEKQTKDSIKKEESEAQDWTHGAKDTNKKQLLEQNRFDLLKKKQQR